MKIANWQANYLLHPTLFAVKPLNVPRSARLKAATAAQDNRATKGQKMEPTKTEKKVTRKSSKHLRVPVLPEEETQIKQKAKAAGHQSVAAYLRDLGLNRKITSVIDPSLVAELAKINAEQGQLASLLKSLLTSEERFCEPGGAETLARLKSVLAKVEATQSAMLELVKHGIRR